MNLPDTPHPAALTAEGKTGREPVRDDASLKNGKKRVREERGWEAAGSGGNGRMVSAGGISVSAPASLDRARIRIAFPSRHPVGSNGSQPGPPCPLALDDGAGASSRRAAAPADARQPGANAARPSQSSNTAVKNGPEPRPAKAKEDNERARADSTAPRAGAEQLEAPTTNQEQWADKWRQQDAAASELKQQLEESRANNARLQRRAAAAEATALGAAGDLRAERARSDTLLKGKTELLQRHNALKLSHDALEVRARVLEAANAELKARNTRLSDRVAASNAHAQKARGLEDSVAALQDTNATLQGKIEAMETEAERHAEAEAELLAENVALCEREEQHREIAEIEENDLKAAQVSVKEKEAQIDKLRAELNRSKKARRNLRARLEEEGKAGEQLRALKKRLVELAEN